MPINPKRLSIKNSVIAVVFVLLLSILGDYVYWRLNQHNQLHEVELQISGHLDKLAQTHRLEHSQLLADYITLTNQYFQQNSKNVLLLSSFDNEISTTGFNPSILTYTKQHFDHPVIIKSRYQLTLMVLLNAALVSVFLWLILPLIRGDNSTHARDQGLRQGTRRPPLLMINLEQRYLALNDGGINHGYRVVLANKPFCFYLALLKYSLDFDEPLLTTNSALPPQFLLDCERYFNTLMRAGHTLRRSPNFESAIDKSLSEIRACIQTLNQQSDYDLSHLIPPKSTGTGARAQEHNIALTQLTSNDYLIQ